MPGLRCSTSVRRRRPTQGTCNHQERPFSNLCSAEQESVRPSRNSGNSYADRREPRGVLAAARGTAATNPINIASTRERFVRRGS